MICYICCGDKMIIYVDLVFILNVFLDFILLMGVSVILTRNARLKRMIFGSFIGGGTTFLLFVNLNILVSLFLKIVFGLLMVIVTFGYRDIKYTMNNMFYLLTISFSVGGVLYLLMDKGFYNYIVLILSFIIVLFLYIKQTKVYYENYSNYYKVEVFIGNKRYELTGFLDTGNKLLYHKKYPVIIVDKKIKHKDEDIVYVPFKSLNNTSVLKCIKSDMVIVNNHTFKNYLIGFSREKIKIDGVNCILNSKMKGDLNV